ncbi:unnamed protein product [Gadus morhua 'NCC']
MAYLEGYILPDKDQDEAASGDDSEGDGEEDTTPEFLDMEVMSDTNSKTAWINQSPGPPKRKVRFKTFSGDEVRVTGRFALSAPWWHITCRTQGPKKNLTVKGSAWYTIRTDLDKDGWRPIVSLFLVACNVTDVSIQPFFEWLPKERLVTILNLLEVLTEFGDTDPLAEDIIEYVSSSDEYRGMQASSSYPLVMKYLPVLLPRQFDALLSSASSENVDSLLAKLEDIIENDVWKLGFSEVMHKELKLRCEAKLNAFEDCGLLKKLPRLQHNALSVYDEVKRFCANTGSTYMEKDKLCHILRKKSHIPDEQVWDTLPFLRELGVMMLDRQKVVLQKHHNYESGIADCLRHLVDAKQWTIPINAQEVLYAHAQKIRIAKVAKDPTMDPSTLSPVKVDPDQLLAAQMICSDPVTVISGCGGCGKTTVVSELFRAAVEKGRPVSSWEYADASEDTEDPMEDPGEHKKGPFYGDESGEDPPGCQFGCSVGGRAGQSGGYQDLGHLPGTSDEGEEEEEEEEEEDMEVERQDDKLLEKQILLTAPTGRAASLLTKKTGFQAYTMHQVIWKFNNAEKKRKENGDVELNWEFESVRVLVLDEGSLVPVGLLHSVLSKLISHAELQKFILLGDVKQLPSIQPGSALEDLFSSLNSVKYNVEMRNNHRSESELIVQNAKRIAAIGMGQSSEPLEFDHVVNLPGPFNIPPGKKFIHIRLPARKGDDDLQKAVKWLMGSAPGLDDDTKSQFIAYRRADVDLINELCCTHYNEHTTKDHKGKFKFQPGDKVCVTKNALIDQEDAKAQRHPGDDDDDKHLRLCNGEIFFITEDHTEVDHRGRKKRSLTLDERPGRIVKAKYRALLGSCKLRHAWARTIHTFQGSETETVVYVVGTGGFQNWRTVYTAVTRGQKRVYVVSTEEELQAAIKRKPDPRLTRLAGLVKEKVVQMVQESPRLQRDRRGSPRSTPQWSTPQKATPQRTTPQKTTPQRTTSQKATPQRSTPQRFTPQRFTPQKATPLRTTPLVPPRQTPGTKAVVKRLWAAGGPVEAPAGSPVKDIVDDQPGTARIGAAAANKTAFEFFSTPRKKTKYVDSAMDCTKLQPPSHVSPMHDPVTPKRPQSPK